MMYLPANLDSVVALVLDRMLYCLAEGMALAGLLSLAIRLFPPRNSRTRFAVWFAALIAVAVLPLLSAAGHLRILAHGAHPVAPGTAWLTIPASWAISILGIWAGLVLLGLLRVSAGLWHVRRLRQSCVPMNPERLGPDLQSAIAELRLSRPVSILVSPAANVPAAVGFFHPMVVVPAWLAEECAAGELQYVLLHELAHLRRRDDWTNLLQKIVKAVLFFHPGIWWIERKLSLDREMACDEAVLKEIPEPRLYAECLARVAEKSFLRRQLALAQAAVDRMKHLSRRIARILGVEPRPAWSTRFWKPAVATVAVAGVLSAVWTAQAPMLVGLADPARVGTEGTGSFSAVPHATIAAGKAERQQGGVVAPVFTAAASLSANSHPPAVVSTLYRPAPKEIGRAPSFSQPHKRSSRGPQRLELMEARYTSLEPTSNAPGETLITVVETRYVTGSQAASGLLQISVVEVRWIVPAKKQIPRKT
jgi:beta-lactamase regulating signal transducer with metallopeptidase domain